MKRDIHPWTLGYHITLTETVGRILLIVLCHHKTVRL